VDQTRRQGRSQPRPLLSVLAKHRTRVYDLSIVLTPGRNGERSSTAKHASSDKSGHTALILKGPRGQRSPRSYQTPSLRHAARTRQHCTAETASTVTHHPNMVRQHIRMNLPIWDGIHDGGFDLEAIQIDGSHNPGARDHGHQLHKTNQAIDDLGAATYSGTTPLGDRR
jgi:hypothetical protein